MPVPLLRERTIGRTAGVGAAAVEDARSEKGTRMNPALMVVRIAVSANRMCSRGRSSSAHPRGVAIRSRALQTLVVASWMLSLIGAACAPANRDQREATAVSVTAVVVGTPIDVIVIDVTAPDIATPLVFNLAVVEGVASGTVKLPPGVARTIRARGFDTSGEITHEGSVTVDVARGNNPPVSVPMVPKAGQVPVTVQLGPVSIVVAPSLLNLVAGASERATAEIRTPDGAAVAEAPAWASTDPSVATVDASGMVIAHRPGDAQIVATYAGTAGFAAIHVALGAQYGNFTPLGAFSNMNAAAGTGGAMGAFAISVTAPGVVRAFGYLASTSAGERIRLGLYSDAGGAPGSLLVQTGPVPVSPGLQLVSVVPTPVATGSYWLAYQAELGTGMFGGAGDPTTTTYVKQPQPFYTSWPQFFSASSSFTGWAWNFWIEAAPDACDTSDLRDYCVCRINAYRATRLLRAYVRWIDAESCVDLQAVSDPAATFCGESGFITGSSEGSAASAAGLDHLLAAAWAQGPGDDGTHSGYLNMASTSMTSVACGMGFNPASGVPSYYVAFR